MENAEHLRDFPISVHSPRVYEIRQPRSPARVQLAGASGPPVAPPCLPVVTPPTSPASPPCVVSSRVLSSRLAAAIRILVRASGLERLRLVPEAHRHKGPISWRCRDKAVLVSWPTGHAWFHGQEEATSGVMGLAAMPGQEVAPVSGPEWCKQQRHWHRSFGCAPYIPPECRS